jgi:hypothetical protein
MLNFIMHKSFSTNFMVLKRTEDLHAIGLRIELKWLRRNVPQTVGKGLWFPLQSPC